MEAEGLEVTKGYYKQPLFFFIFKKTAGCKIASAYQKYKKDGKTKNIKNINYKEREIRKRGRESLDVKFSFKSLQAAFSYLIYEIFSSRYVLSSFNLEIDTILFQLQSCYLLFTVLLLEFLLKHFMSVNLLEISLADSYQIYTRSKFTPLDHFTLHIPPKESSKRNPPQCLIVPKKNRELIISIQSPITLSSTPS